MAVLESATKKPAKRPRRHIDVEPENASTRRRIATCRRRNLQRAADQHLPPDSADLGKGELEADREEQQDDAHLRQHLDIVLCPDDADACWSGDGAGHDEGDDRWDPDAAQGEDEDQGDGVSQDQFGQGRVRGHASV